MPRAPITPSIVAGPVGRGTYSAQDVAQVQPQEPGMLVQQGQQLQRLGGALEDVAEVQRIKQVRSLAIEQDTKLAESFRNSRSEFGKLQGRKAVDAFPEYEKSIRESAKKLLEGIEDPLAQRLIRESADQRIQQNLNEAAAYRDKQQEAWLDGAEQAAVLGAVEDYKLGVREGDKNADRFFVTALKEQRQMDERKGLSHEQRRVNELAITTMLHGGVVEGMIERGEGIKAFQYIETNKKEMAADFYAKQQPKAKAAFIEQGARKIDETLPTFTEKLQAVQEMQGASDEDKASAIRHLKQFEGERAETRAIEARDVKRQADDWNAANPFLDMRSENPALYSQVAKYGVTSERERVNVQQFIDQSRTPEGMRRLRAMTPEQREYDYSRFTTKSKAEEIEKQVVGDQSGLSILKRTHDLATAIGVDPNDDVAFASFQRNTIDPIVDAERTKLGRPLNPTEFQEKVIDPMMKDKVLVDGFFGYTEMPVIQAQQEGYLPIDNPETPGVDESLDVKNATVAVRVDGQVVRLAQIPMDQRRKIREAYRQEWVAQRGSAASMPQMTAAEEAARWVRGGRVGDKTKRAAEDMRVPGVGWGVGDLNRADLPPLPDRSGEPDEYIIPGVQQAELPK